MRVVFRADASIQIGSGHIMRCLTLADALAARGIDCHFICREHPGHLLDAIRHKGFAVHVLPRAETGDEASSKPLAHADWLGSSQDQDAAECRRMLAELRPDWLVVDHYALDARWEGQLKPCSGKLMVIDDLADREHQCDLLLDQTLGRRADDYRALVPADSRILCGSNFALLRPEFAAWRQAGLERRKQARLRRLLVNLGGVDKDNVTARVLAALSLCELPADLRITVVMGATAPHLEQVRRVAQSMPWSTEVLVGVSNMAELMVASDLAIGAAGATSWERCCLGLPGILIVLADNQKQVALGLQQAGAVALVATDSSFSQALEDALRRLQESPELLAAMASSAADIVDGQGIARVIQQLEL
ncbi:UDP-2,4-diacetamido-2,4,6-trideoxy-beta-L-altropyranose hydrolase [Halopseudomonas salegens]|uniref:UDP-2,4-diacetamido-2,4,6-trideoxy-beta-L-altropyranose hydrolase n=1 Tax=Halopseudomonas salegens TaxID=1434072 RepID=A0A1H2EJT2_9GAMM|nr:UDP-2,4-diacetamido-2,4,6-trideoxy-beta-L-altropyranose hydrolase [Halopseudomonas salegens]SDT95367.1 UDP-2,4-diacetamido-2,4,6-trideoxy-beta-L-altropyranose hydrolase [Halopseudomonas salegens]